jgi:hypothetical protein
LSGAADVPAGNGDTQDADALLINALSANEEGDGGLDVFDALIWIL